ncbi:MAG: UDP-2,3-diacylglucosamine diphosphatase [Rhodothermales bacterium]
MILFISDTHFGRGDPASERAKELDLIACLRHHREGVEHLYLLGDVFEEFIEYRRVAPKGFERLKGLLAEWTDGGIPVTYLVGNHDPWHRDYFESELGVRVEFDNLTVSHDDLLLHLAHGDRVVERSGARAWLKSWLRHPAPVWIYRSLLPADFGMWLAGFVNRRFGNREVDSELVALLREQARRILRESPADVVIFGHSHQPELVSWPEGRYLNPGYWHESRTFGRLDHGKLQLARWNGQTAEIVQE